MKRARTQGPFEALRPGSTMGDRTKGAWPPTDIQNAFLFGHHLAAAAPAGSVGARHCTLPVILLSPLAFPFIWDAGSLSVLDGAHGPDVCRILPQQPPNSSSRSPTSSDQSHRDLQPSMPRVRANYTHLTQPCGLRIAQHAARII